jgi:hypothetical protein
MRMNENIVSHTNKGRYFFISTKKAQLTNKEQIKIQSSTAQMKKNKK